MRGTNYDLILVGGGLGGAALAFAMARHGARVLVVEREVTFRDRVRGEGVAPWGVAEASSCCATRAASRSVACRSTRGRG